MKIKPIGMGIFLAFLTVSCASTGIHDADLEADEALGEADADLEQEAVRAQETLRQAQLERQREQQKQLERQITDLGLDESI